MGYNHQPIRRTNELRLSNRSSCAGVHELIRPPPVCQHTYLRKNMGCSIIQLFFQLFVLFLNLRFFSFEITGEFFSEHSFYYECFNIITVLKTWKELSNYPYFKPTSWLLCLEEFEVGNGWQEDKYQAREEHLLGAAVNQEADDGRWISSKRRIICWKQLLIKSLMLVKLQWIKTQVIFQEYIYFSEIKFYKWK